MTRLVHGMRLCRTLCTGSISVKLVSLPSTWVSINYRNFCSITGSHQSCRQPFHAFYAKCSTQNPRENCICFAWTYHKHVLVGIFPTKRRFSECPDHCTFQRSTWPGDFHCMLGCSLGEPTQSFLLAGIPGMRGGSTSPCSFPSFPFPDPSVISATSIPPATGFISATMPGPKKDWNLL